MTHPRVPVPSMPTLSPGALVPRRGGSLPPPLDGPEVSLWFSGRVALYQAARAFGLGPGEAVALPAFCCGSEVEPFHHAGAELRFYALDAELRPEPESFARALAGARVALVTHFFGFPRLAPDTAAAAREAGTILVEDCAHALYATEGGEAIGGLGDAAVFSMRKTLPLPDGAALRLNRTPVTPPPPSEPAPQAVVKARLRRLVGQGLVSSSSPLVRLAVGAAVGAKHRLERRTPATPGPVADEATPELYEEIRFRPERSCSGISRRSRSLLVGTPHEHVLARRREIYRSLEPAVERAAGLRPLFAELPAGACPLFFPVLAEDPTAVRRHMAERRVGVKHMWPWFSELVPWQDFPHEADLKHRVLALPVHQALTDAQVERIAHTLGELGTEER